MGCGTSKMEPGEEIPSGMAPFMRRIHDLKRARVEAMRMGRRERKDSIVSTAELLRPEERDIDYFDAAAMDQSSKDADEEEERRIGFGREKRATMAGAPPIEDLPGSPSFRYYFAGSAETKNSADEEDAVKPVVEKELLEEKEGNECLTRMQQGSDCKVIRKEKGRKFMALPKPNFLNVRGCYSMNSCSLNARVGARILTEKAT